MTVIRHLWIAFVCVFVKARQKDTGEKCVINYVSMYIVK